MASIREKMAKDGSIFYEIRVFRPGKSPMSKAWHPPVGWSRRSIEKELGKVSAEFERQVKTGEIISKAEQAEKKAEEEAEKAKLKTLRQYTESVFMPEKERTLSENGRNSYQSNIDLHILPFLGDVLLMDITPAMLKKRLLDFESSGKSVASCVKLYNILNGILQMAFEDDSISINPMLKVKRPSARKDEAIDSQPKSLTEDETNYVYNCLEKEPLKWRAYICLAIDTGARRGELCGLEWKDIDYENELISIRQNVQYTSKKGLYITTPKNGKTRRVDIGSETIAILKQWQKEQSKECICKYVFSPEKSNQNKHKQDAHCHRKQDEKKVLPIESNPMHPQSPTGYFKKFGEKYGIQNFHPHLLRHTSASIAITNGADVVSVSQRLGHSDSAVTLRMYAHASEESVRRAGQIFRDALKQKHG